MTTEDRQPQLPEFDQNGRPVGAVEQKDNACILDSETAWVPAKWLFAGTFVFGLLLLVVDILEI